jgi:uncharacterized protein YggE
MDSKIYLGAVAILMIAVASLLVAVDDQRQLIYLNPSSGTRISSPAGELASWGGVWAQSDGSLTDNTLYVSGSAVASDNPDKVTIYFSVETQDNSALVSQQQNAQITSAVRSALVAKGIASDSIETTGYSLYQAREYDPDYRKYINQGFKTTHSMKVELSDISRAGEIIDAAVSGGATTVDSVSFGLSDSKLEQLRLSALETAAENARKSADSIADGLGVSIKRVMSASEGYSYTPVTRTYAMEDVASGGAASTEITPGDISVTSTVNVVFEIA